MTDLTLKYYLLNTSAKKEVLDFIDFLLTKEIKSTKPPKNDYKKKILKVSVWDDPDIYTLINHSKQI